MPLAVRFAQTYYRPWQRIKPRAARETLKAIIRRIAESDCTDLTDEVYEIERISSENIHRIAYKRYMLEFKCDHARGKLVLKQPEYQQKAVRERQIEAGGDRKKIDR